MPCEDKKNPKTGRSDCPKLAKYCNHPVIWLYQLPFGNSWYFSNTTTWWQSNVLRPVKDAEERARMTVVSTKTLPFYGIMVPFAGLDGVNPKTGKSDCPRLKYLCQHPVYRFTTHYFGSLWYFSNTTLWWSRNVQKVADTASKFPKRSQLSTFYY